MPFIERALTTVIGAGLAACASNLVAPTSAPGVAERGERVYAAYCATCHGVGGDGRGPTAAHVVGRPPADFTRGVYRYTSVQRGTVPTDDDLVWTILRGVPGTAMPSWAGILDANDARDVAAYLETFSLRFTDPEARARPIEIPTRRPPPSDESRARGRDLFLAAQCWQCHGLAGEGNGPSATKLVDEAGQKVRPANLTAGFHTGGQEADLYRVLVTGIDGTPMMPAPLPLVRESESQLDLLAPLVSQGELDHVRAFVRALPTGEDLFSLDDADRERLIAAWRWDLVDYLMTLPRRSRWPALLGTDAPRPLYGGRPSVPPLPAAPAPDGP